MDVADVGPDEDVGRLADVLVEAIARDGVAAHAEVEAVAQGGLVVAGDVDGDHEVGAQLVARLDRHAEGAAAVDDHPAVHLERGEHAGDGAAGIQAIEQRALVEGHHLARVEVDRNGGQREPQVVESLAALEEAREGTAQARGRLDRTRGHGLDRDAAALHEVEQAVPGADDGLAVVVAVRDERGPLRGELAVAGVAVEGLPDLGGVLVARIEGTDDRAHARAGDHVDGYVGLVQCIEHAAVGETAGAAATEGDADLRSNHAISSVGPDAGRVRG